MELVTVKCNRCNHEFLTIVKTGEIECPVCGNRDDMVVAEEGDGKEEVR